MSFFLAGVLGYLAGSVPIAYAMGRVRGIDLRSAGSRNLGAANVLRTAGIIPAIVVLLGDAAKGALAVVAAGAMSGSLAAATLSGLAAVIGHIFPVWLRFRGGKGVATAAGVFGMLAPVATVIAVIAFIVTVLLTRFVSAGSIVASLALPLAAGTLASPAPVVGASVIAAILIISRHRSNLSRLASGTERRIGMKA